MIEMPFDDQAQPAAESEYERIVQHAVRAVCSGERAARAAFDEPRPLLGLQVLRALDVPAARSWRIVLDAWRDGAIPLWLDLAAVAEDDLVPLVPWSMRLDASPEWGWRGIQETALTAAWKAITEHRSGEPVVMTRSGLRMLRRLDGLLSVAKPEQRSRYVDICLRDLPVIAPVDVVHDPNFPQQPLALLPTWYAQAFGIETVALSGMRRRLQSKRQRRKQRRIPDSALRMRDAGRSWGQIALALGVTVPQYRELVADEKKSRRVTLSDSGPRSRQDDEGPQ